MSLRRKPACSLLVDLFLGYCMECFFHCAVGRVVNSRSIRQRSTRTASVSEQPVQCLLPSSSNQQLLRAAVIRSAWPNHDAGDLPFSFHFHTFNWSLINLLGSVQTWQAQSCLGSRPCSLQNLLRTPSPSDSARTCRWHSIFSDHQLLPCCLWHSLHGVFHDWLLFPQLDTEAISTRTHLHQNTLLCGLLSFRGFISSFFISDSWVFERRVSAVRRRRLFGGPAVPPGRWESAGSCIHLEVSSFFFRSYSLCWPFFCFMFHEFEFFSFLVSRIQRNGLEPKSRSSFERRASAVRRRRLFGGPAVPAGRRESVRCATLLEFFCCAVRYLSKCQCQFV